jgi:hypothetical protein
MAASGSSLNSSTSGGSGRLLSTTVQIQEIDRGVPELMDYFEGVDGIERVGNVFIFACWPLIMVCTHTFSTIQGYHVKSIFIVFADRRSALDGVRQINQETSMKARNVEFEYTPHFSKSSPNISTSVCPTCIYRFMYIIAPGGLGDPCTTLRMNL